MELSEIIFDMKLIGSRSHRDYDTMVKNWIIAENNPLPTYEECIETWNNKTYNRVTEQKKQELILEVKELANKALSDTDWKVTKHLETNNLSEIEFKELKALRQTIRDKSNQIENEIKLLQNLEDVENYKIKY